MSNPLNFQESKGFVSARMKTAAVETISSFHHLNDSLKEKGAEPTTFLKLYLNNFRGSKNTDVRLQAVAASLEKVQGNPIYKNKLIDSYLRHAGKEKSIEVHEATVFALKELKVPLVDQISYHHKLLESENPHIAKSSQAAIDDIMKNDSVKILQGAERKKTRSFRTQALALYQDTMSRVKKVETWEHMYYDAIDTLKTFRTFGYEMSEKALSSPIPKMRQAGAKAMFKVAMRINNRESRDKIRNTLVKLGAQEKDKETHNVFKDLYHAVPRMQDSSIFYALPEFPKFVRKCMEMQSSDVSLIPVACQVNPVMARQNGKNTR